MHDESSIQRQLHREKTFIPPYCPNPKCKHHSGGVEFFQKDGTSKLKRFPYLSQRFRCKECGITFAYSFFFLEYRARIWGKNEAIFLDHRNNISCCETARQIGHSERMVRGRKQKMNRWGLLKHAKFTENLKVEEPIVYDGLENFSFSQYSPNNINQALGQDSLFLYDFNFAPINRKGKMKPSQRRKKRKLEEIHGEYPKDSLLTSTKRLFARLLKKTEKLILHTDYHFQYERAVKQLKVEGSLDGKKLNHIQTSSKAVRNYQNPLFAVNHVDLQIRQELGTFRRETIAFAKHSIAMQESYCLYMLYRNYMRPKFFKPHEADPECHKKSPAMYVGVTKEVLSFKEFFGVRVLSTQVKLHEDWKALYHREDAHSRQPIKRAA